MKILCVIDSLGSGGAQRQMVNLAVGFKGKGHEVSFLTYHDSTFFLPILERYKIPVTCIANPHYLMRLLKLRKFIRTGEFDSVLSFQESANFICEFAGLPYRKWKLCIGERSADPRIIKSLKSRFFRWFHFFADEIIANSETNIQLVRKANPFLRQKKLHVIYNTVDFNYWKPIVSYIPKESGKLNLVVAASHIQYKNLLGLVSALKLLPKELLTEIEIHWYGKGSKESITDLSFIEAKKVIDLNKLNEIIYFHEATTNILEVIQQADAVGLFSFFEGFPNVVCEAMACAKPVICSSISDLPIILTKDSKLLFNPHSAEDIKNSIVHLLSLTENELIEYGEFNRIEALKYFNKNHIVDEYLKILS